MQLPTPTSFNLAALPSAWYLPWLPPTHPLENPPVCLLVRMSIMWTRFKKRTCLCLKVPGQENKQPLEPIVVCLIFC